MSWESTNQFDIGFDLSLLNNRVFIIGDYYRKKTYDLLFNVDLPGTSGYSSITTNLGEMENKGLEFSITTKNLVGNIKWTTEANITYNKNMILSLPNGEDQFSGIGIVREGEALGSFYGYIFDGVFASDQDVPEGLTTGGGINFEGGDAIFKNVNSDNIINEKDMSIIGNAQPDFVGGVGNTISYKNFNLNVLLTYSIGNDIYNSLEQMRAGNGFSPNPRPYVYENTWRKQGDQTDVPVNWMVKPVGNDRNSSRWVEDGSYLRIKTVTLGYNFNDELLRKLKVESLKIVLTGQNIWTFTNYLGYDPEVVTTSSENSRQFGIDNARMPIPTTYMLSLNVGF